MVVSLSARKRKEELREDPEVSSSAIDVSYRITKVKIHANFHILRGTDVDYQTLSVVLSRNLRFYNQGSEFSQLS